MLSYNTLTLRIVTIFRQYNQNDIEHAIITIVSTITTFVSRPTIIQIKRGAKQCAPV